MGIFSFFRSRPKGTATTAKERLQVLIAHQHKTSEGPDYLPLLKKDILNVIKKYVDIGEEQVLVQLDSQDDCDVLELNITLPEDAATTDNKDQENKKSAAAESKTTNKNLQKKQQRNNKSTTINNSQKGKKTNSRKHQKQKKPTATEDSSN